MRVKIVKICPRSPTMLATIAQVRQAAAAALTLACLLAAAPAAAQDGAGLFRGWEALGSGEMAGERAGEGGAYPVGDVIATSATVQDNIVTDSVSGNNYASSGAFSGASGFPTLIQNSGNHVVIQNATIVNLSIGN